MRVHDRHLRMGIAISASMAGECVMDFTSLQAQLAYWFAPGNQHGTGYANISQRFGVNKGEPGLDIVLPFHSAVYSPLAGVVKGTHVDASGLSVWMETAPDKMFYFQHMDTTALHVGQYVQPGDFIGLSGGQNVGGQHPASPANSTGPHIEVGYNWWQPLGKNIDPLPSLLSIAASYHELPAVPTRKTGNSGDATFAANCGKGWLGIADTQTPNVAICALLAANPSIAVNFPCATLACLQAGQQNPIIQGSAAAGNITQIALDWFGNPIRIVKLVMGGALILIALWLAFRQQIAGAVGETASFAQEVFA